ncbi:hypothetical protein NBRC3257_0907 [Gluconobacter thailandicus NBRC 3257]|uniref:Uncharacterized protein n=1 Tax=Gluconobacter thailandicus NBRC 3257 TaxID=1381097 RepID=A0ABQ0IWL9_GLUTH|nr:hypothetical protein NBRC3255_0008 [Gluconobacter thailandicus NBRC 3255]GAD25908.1 hypothetical protein NBRC3257_0907 [Gluconobacter thailandicus NBRC 3257]
MQNIFSLNRGFAMTFTQSTKEQTRRTHAQDRGLNKKARNSHPETHPGSGAEKRGFL